MRESFDPETGEILAENPALAAFRDTAPDALLTLRQLHIGGAPVDRLLTRFLADASMALADVGDPKDKAEVLVKLQLTRAKGPNALVCHATVAAKHPTAHGKRAEETGAATEVWVSKTGALTLAPDTQGKLPL